MSIYKTLAISLMAAVAPATVSLAQTCGAMNGALISSIPKTNLCTAGTASMVSGTASPWTWTCGGAVPASCATAVPTKTWWQPGPNAQEWQWEIDHPINLKSAADMGTGKTAYTGAIAPATDPVIYDTDGFDNPAATVTALHALGKTAVCYIEVGAIENYRSDYKSFPASVIGKGMPGYPAEKYIDIRSPIVVGLIEARIQMCATKGFDVIEPDIDESYGSNTGFPLTKVIEEAYMITLTTYAHSLGLAMLGKNPDDTGDSYAADMFPVFDGILTEQCNEYDSCNLLDAYTGFKPVFNAEYSTGGGGRRGGGGTGTPAFCTNDDAKGQGWNGTFFPVDLNGPRTPCR